MENRQEKGPVSVSSLAADDTLDRATNSEVLDFPHRIERYGRARKRAVAMWFYLFTSKPLNPAPIPDLDPEQLPKKSEAQLIKKARIRLKDCGNWLHFRNYYTIDTIRLVNASFCKMHLLCPLCAIRRGAKYLAAYLKRYQQIKKDNPKLRPYLITFTIKNQDDLALAFKHLKGSLKTLVDRRRAFLHGKKRNATYTELTKVLGAVYTFEVTNKGQGWHPHIHMIALCEETPSQVQLREEWHAITGDSYIVDVTPFRIPESPSEALLPSEIDAFIEVFKYAVKFSDLSLQNNWEAYTVLKGQRLMGSLGLFRSVNVPEELTDEIPEEELPYIDLLYSFVKGHYQLKNIIHPAE
jgi:hypothetical protein